MVRTGHGVAYSKGWPKLPGDPCADRRGDISWSWVGGLSPESAIFWYEQELGDWCEVVPGEWKFAQGRSGELTTRGSPGNSDRKTCPGQRDL
jgi:hypothetical protein